MSSLQTRYARLIMAGYRHFWLLLVPLLALPALAPLYTEGLPRSYDGGYHLLRLAVLDRAVADGTFLPRWAPDIIIAVLRPLPLT